MTAPTSRVVRVFISSTFRDFGAERDLMMKRVFPELRRRARARFVEVIGVDLRWGITEEESEKGETLPICLREIERSRPYFVCLLGERYGWTPAAGQYPELLLEQQPWLREHAGGKSVTELEILHGVLNAPEMAGRAYFYFRDPAFSEGKGADYASEDEDARGKLARLKERIRVSAFPVAGFATPEEVADRITDDLWRLIDAEYPEDAVPDELERERRSHEAYAAERRRLYIGQEETVSALLARLESANNEPGEEGSRTRTTLVTAESGTGKSALIANTLARYREAHPDHVVIEHYIGSTSEASDPLKVIRRVSEEIKRLTGSSREVEDDPEKLVEQFVEWLAEASWWARKQGVCLVLALDALDKLSERSDLRWLPKVTAPHVRVVVSSLDGAAVEAMRKRAPGELQARPFTPEVARNYIVETLARRGRRLPVREVDRIVSHPRATLPIYLKTLVEELSVFGSHEGLSQRITECLAAQEPDDLFEVILARLEEDLGRDAVKKPLEAIWASSEGMSEDELVGFTGVSPLELARLRLSLDDALYEMGGLLRLAHAYEAKGVEDRYAPTDEGKRESHRALGLWWEKQEPGARMAGRLNFHLHAAQAWGEMRRCLTEPRTGMAMVRFVSDHDLYASWMEIAAFLGRPSLARCIDEEFARAWPVWRDSALEGSPALHAFGPLVDFLSYSGAVMGIARQVADEMTACCRRRAAEIGTPQSRSEVSVSLDNVAGIERARGDLGAALATYEEGLGIARALAEELGTPESLRDLSVFLDNAARIEEARGDLDAALAKYKESLEICRGLAEELRTHESLRGVSVSLNHVARIEEVRGDLDAALAKYEESFEIRRALMEQLGTPECRRHVSLSLSNVAGIEQIRGDLDGALAKHEESLEIARALAEELGTPQSRHDLIRCLNGLGNIEEERGDLDAALVKYRDGLEIARALAGELGTPDSRHDLSVFLQDVARIEEVHGDLDAALAKYEENLEIRRALVGQLGTPESRRGVSMSLDDVAGIENSRGDLDAAYARYMESLEIRRGLAEELGTPESLRDESVSLDKVAGIEESRGDLDAAHAKYVESLEIARGLAEGLGTPRSLRDVSVRLHKVAGIEEARGDLDAAQAKYVESLEILRGLAEKLGTPGSLRDVSVSLNNVAGIEKSRGDLDAAHAKYVESLEILRGLAEELGTPESLRDVSACLNNVAGIEKSRGDLDAAYAKYVEILEIRRGLAEELGNPGSQNAHLWSVHLTASCLVLLSRPGEALAMLTGASAAATKFESSCGDDLNMLDTCAAFHETYARAFAALGRIDEAQRRSEHGAAIRARIAALKDGGRQ